MYVGLYVCIYMYTYTYFSVCQRTYRCVCIGLCVCISKYMIQKFYQTNLTLILRCLLIFNMLPSLKRCCWLVPPLLISQVTDKKMD